MADSEYKLIFKTTDAVVEIFGPVDPALSSEAQSQLEESRSQRLRRWLRAGEIRGRKIGGDWYISASELRRFNKELVQADG